MSEIDRAELRRLLDEATPRPWWQEWVEGDEWFAVYGQPTGDLVCPEVCTAGDADDTNLLVAAVNALPGLLGALEKAEGHRDSLAATLIEVQREKLALERAIERARALHTCEARWGNEDYSIDADEYAARKAENDEGWDLDTLARFDVCAECYRIERSIEQRDDGVAVLEGLWPCPTIQALDGGGRDE